MSRLQISDNFGNQQLQTQARPAAQVEQVAAPVADRRWQDLAKVFDGGATLAAQGAAAAEEAERAEAKRWAQSMTVSELGKQIESGHMMPSQSPVFVGTVQHIWGVNSHEAIAREVSSKLTTGELKFNSAQEADTYLTEARNTALSGQSKYAVAGFDKGFGQLRERVMKGVDQINDKTLVDAAPAQATDYLANSLNQVTRGDFKGTPQEAAAQVMQQYDLMRKTKTLPDAAAKAALGDVVTRMAGSGNAALLNAFLDTDMGDSKGSVRAVLGESKAQTLSNHATTVFDGKQRQRIDDEMLPWYDQATAGTLTPKFREWANSDENKKYISSATIHSIEQANLSALARQQRELEKSAVAGIIAGSEAEADRKIEAALVTLNLPSVMGTKKPTVLDKHGEPKELSDTDVKERAERIAVKRTAGLPFEQQVGLFSQNGLKNPDWENTMNAAFYNLGTIAVDSKGKPTGTLNQAGRDGVELFKKLDAFGDYARSLMPEKQYSRFSDIAFLTRMNRSVDDAAGIAAAVDAGAVPGSPADKLVKNVQAQVGKMAADPAYKFDFIQRMWGDNTTANTAQLHGTLLRFSTLLAHSGQYGDAESAIAAAAKRLSDPTVSAKVNGTLYLRSEMPTGPSMHTQEDWFDKWLTAVPKARAKEIGFKDNEVRMEFDPTIKAYRGMAGGIPLTNPDNSLMVVRKDDIQAWYGVQSGIEITNAAAKGAAVQQVRTDAVTDGAKVSDWAKNNFNKPGPATPPKAEPPAAPKRTIPDIDWNAIKRPGSGKPAAMP